MALVLGPVGVWSIGLRNEDATAQRQVQAAAAELERLGYAAIWLGGSPDVSLAAPILEATSRMVVATGITPIWKDTAAALAERHADLAARHPGRLVLGLGVSHAALVPGYQRPYSAMVRFLDDLDASPRPVPQSERVLAALGPRMLSLARDRTAGAHPYLVTPEHTAQARTILGTGPVLAPEVKVVAETEPSLARERARKHLSRYLTLPNYTSNLLRLGFGEDDLAGGGSDRLVDATVAWGSDEAIRRRITEFRAAGADHVALQVLTDGRTDLPIQVWRRLASVLSLT